MTNKSRMTGTCSLLLFALLLFGGCAEGPPSEEQMKKDLMPGLVCGVLRYSFSSPSAFSQFKIEQRDERAAFADYTISFKFSMPEPDNGILTAKVHWAYWRRENNWVLDKVECRGVNRD